MSNLVDVSIDGDQPGWLLHQAAIYDNIDLMRSLLEGPERQNVNSQDSCGRSPLYTSVTYNSVRCCQLLLANGADANLTCGLQFGGMTPLHVAASENNVVIVKVLLEHCADLQKRDASGKRPLELAEMNRSMECMAAIFEKQEKENQVKDQLQKDFIEACLRFDVDLARQISMDPGLTLQDVVSIINGFRLDHLDLLYRACDQGHEMMCEFLLQNGATVTSNPTNGQNPLHVSCLFGYVNCARLLLKQYPDLSDITTFDGNLPIHIACLLEQVEAIKLLLVHCAHRLLDQRSTVGCVKKELTRMVNARDAHGQTALHIAVINNHVTLVQFLLHGCLTVDCQESQHEIKSDSELTSFQIWTENMQFSANKMDDERSDITDVDLEFRFLVEVDATDLEGKTPLHLAVLGDGKVSYSDIVSLLLQHKADPNRPMIKTDNSSVALMEAVQRSDLVLIDLLLRHGAKDEAHKVLKTAIMLQDDRAIGCIIKYQAYFDSEFKIKEKHLVELLKHENEGSEALLTAKFADMSAIMICWHGLSLQKIAESWLHSACRYRLCMLRLVSDEIAHNQSMCFIFVTRIDVSNNNLSVLPSFLFMLPNIRILNASFNQIRAITSDCTTSRLKDAKNVGNAKFLPADFQIEDYSNEIEMNCPFLEDISFQKNQLLILPTALFKLPSLKHLNASHNRICSLPFEIWTSSSIVELNFSNNCLDFLPCFPDMPFSDNRLDELSCLSTSSSGDSENENSQVFADLREADGTKITKLLNSSSVGEPTDLVKDYRTLPINFVNLWQEGVEVEQASINQAVDMKADRHSQLKELDLSGNKLEEVPHGLPCLAPHLEKLSLAYNLLTHSGSPDMYPAKLKSLDLSQNFILSETDLNKTTSINIGRALSPSVNRCSSLCYSPFQSKSSSHLAALSMPNVMLRRLSSTSSCQSLSSLVSTVAPWLCPHRHHQNFSRLKSLKLNSNRLVRFDIHINSPAESDGRLFSPGDEHKRMAASYDCPLSQTKLTSITNKKHLREKKSERRNYDLLYPNLILLDLSSNEITTLPSGINELLQLAELKISCNKIRELPPEMGLMKKLWYLDFANCPVEATLHSILGEKATRTTTVLSYLKSVQEEAKPFNHMKLMFVGKEDIGKTSLLAQLRYYSGDRNRFTHWAQRMGHETKDKDQKGENISTVGVDIGRFEIQRGSDKVIFSTWDFGGQREYYATHQYFLSKRSLYLVIWRVTDGEDGVNEILHWLINIQARAPNSPVIIVGTHRDALRKNFSKSYLDDLGELIERKYIQVTDPDKLGLPRVKGHLEVSCKGSLMTRSYISQLVDMIWKVANEEQQPGNAGSRLLDQLVPASYLRLQDVVIKLAEERKSEHKDPVLYGGQYRHMVIGKMEEMFGRSFQDISELNQATQFLHENGILLHYDDINLRDIYFLDPQWLCDMLSSVITIREINGLVKSGLMRTDDLKLLFKGISFKSQDIKSYIVDLLQKFEVALLWNECSLLIPSLLPSDRGLATGLCKDINIPVQGSNRNLFQETASNDRICTNLIKGCSSVENNKSVHIEHSETMQKSENGMGAVWMASNDQDDVVISKIVNPAISVVRLYIMSYFPCGFWPRLITHLLGDKCFYQMLLSLYDFSIFQSSVEEILMKMNKVPCWTCWQTGVQLKLFDITMLQIKEVTQYSRGLFDYRYFNLKMKPESDFHGNLINTNGMSILEILIPNETLEVQVSLAKFGPKQNERFVMYPSSQVVSLLLAKVVDCIDLLLEDWYPDIGIRFTQNTRGMYLITRLVPCTRCFLQHSNQIMKVVKNDDWAVVDVSESTQTYKQTDSVDHNIRSEVSRSHVTMLPVTERLGRTKSSTQLQDRSHLKDGIRSYSCDREMKKQKSDRPLTGKVTVRNDTEFYFVADLADVPKDVHCYTVEQCLQAAQLNRVVFCPQHGNLGPFFVASNDGLVFSGHVAPDTVFQDIPNELLIDRDSIVLRKFLGKGAFGAVYSGTIVRKHVSDVIPVALKMMQPIKPPAGATFSQQQLYQIEKSRWDKQPLKNCCEAYLNARKELSILLSLTHEHMVPLVGVSVSPLCLILSLAPLGALSEWLKDYLRSGTRLPVYVICQIIIQVSSALQYLHSHQVIYRDLKSENVLVWSLPPPHSTDCFHPVNIKLADYGVSRVVLPFGAKGFAGTLAFMAPEIMRHGGEETYTEKVDCYSFGMFIYELLLLRPPYDEVGNYSGSNINIKAHVLAGGRPLITNKEVNFPTNILDLMALCWSADPNDRPSAAEILAFAKNIEFSALHSALVLDDQIEVISSCSAFRPLTAFDPESNKFSDICANGSRKMQCDVWMSVQEFASLSGSLLVYTFEEQECVESKRISFDFGARVNCMCVTATNIWCASTESKVHVFSRSDYNNIMSFSVPGVIAYMAYGEFEDQVYAVLENGQFLVCSGTRNADTIPVINEYMGNGEPVHSMAAIQTSQVYSEVWCGQTQGKIQIWKFSVGAVCLQTLVHLENQESLFSTSLLVAGLSDSGILWSYVCPGTLVYCWNTRRKYLIGSVDITEQLHWQSLDPEAMTCSVTSLNYQGSYLYIGLTSGCFLTVDAKSLALVNLYQAHDYPILAILPMSFSCNHTAKHSAEHLDCPDRLQTVWSSCSWLLTIGRGYRELVKIVMERFQKEKNNMTGRTFLLTWSVNNFSESVLNQTNHFFKYRPGSGR